MLGQDRYDAAFVIFAFVLQVILLVFFALRKWQYDFAIQHGWIIYALGIPAAVLSLWLMSGGKNWVFWIGGFLLLAWGILGYTVDIARPVTWRGPILWPVFIPYVALYLSAQLFYWWPVGMISRPLWFTYALLFVVSTILNITSHAKPG